MKGIAGGDPVQKEQNQGPAFIRNAHLPGKTDSYSAHLWNDNCSKLKEKVWVKFLVQHKLKGKNVRDE